MHTTFSENSAENDTTAMQKTVLFSHCGDIPPKNGIFPYYLRSCSIFMFLLDCKNICSWHCMYPQYKCKSTNLERSS